MPAATLAAVEAATITALLASVLGFAGKLLAGAPGIHRAITRHLTTYERLPVESESRAELLAHVDHLVRQSIENETTKRRDWFGAGIGASFTIGAVAMVLVAIGADSWGWAWWAGAVVLLVFGGVGTITSLELKERDEKGRAVGKA